MEDLNLPQFQFKIRDSDLGAEVWDSFRKKYILLTPEEWVRQNFAKFMEKELCYPKSLLKLEGSLQYNRRNKRPDIIAFDNSGVPLVVVECKSTHVAINQSVFEQAAVYNKVLRAKYLMVTNGVKHYCCMQNFETGKVEFMDHLPRYDELK